VCRLNRSSLRWWVSTVFPERRRCPGGRAFISRWFGRHVTFNCAAERLWVSSGNGNMIQAVSAHSCWPQTLIRCFPALPSSFVWNMSELFAVKLSVLEFNGTCSREGSGRDCHNVTLRNIQSVHLGIFPGAGAVHVFWTVSQACCSSSAGAETKSNLMMDVYGWENKTPSFIHPPLAFWGTCTSFLVKAVLICLIEGKRKEIVAGKSVRTFWNSQDSCI